VSLARVRKNRSPLGCSSHGRSVCRESRSSLRFPMGRSSHGRGARRVTRSACLGHRSARRSPVGRSSHGRSTCRTSRSPLRFPVGRSSFGRRGQRATRSPWLGRLSACRSPAGRSSFGPSARLEHRSALRFPVGHSSFGRSALRFPVGRSSFGRSRFRARLSPLRRPVGRTSYGTRRAVAARCEQAGWGFRIEPRAAFVLPPPLVETLCRFYWDSGTAGRPRPPSTSRRSQKGPSYPHVTSRAALPVGRRRRLGVPLSQYYPHRAVAVRGHRRWFRGHPY